jgi:hypothetical protein
MVASFLGGGLGAMTTGNTVARVVPRGLQKAYDTVSPAFASKYLSGLKGSGSVSEAGSVLKNGVKEAVGDLSANKASFAVQEQLGIASREAGGPDLLAAQLAKRQRLSEELQAPVPITAAASDNRAINEMVQKAVTGSPEFRGALKADTEATLESIPKALDERIGSQAEALETLDSYVPRSFTEVPVSKERLSKLKSEVDNLTSELTSGVRPKTEVGAELQTKIAERQRLEMDALGPEYKKVLLGGTKEGLKVSPLDIENTIGPSIRSAIDSNLFTTFPKLNSDLRTINSKLSQAAKEGEEKLSSLVSAEGKPFVGVPAVAKEDQTALTLWELDSFKRELAAQMRKVPAQSPEYRVMREIQDNLKGKVYREQDFREPGVLNSGQKVSVTPQADGSFVSQGLYERISPKFAQEYAAVDKEYAQRIGEVFLEKAPMDIGRKEFASDVVPYALRTPEGMQQLMKAAGQDGGRLGTEVILTKLDDLIKAPGGITPAILNNFQKKYASQIEAVTKTGGDISEKLSSTKTALEANVAQQVQLMERTAAGVASDVLVTGGVNSVGKAFEDPAAMVRHFKNSPGDLAKWTKQVGAANPDQREAMSTAILQQYFGGSLPLSSLQTDLKKNAPMRLLVSEKMGKVVELLELAQNISKIPAPQGSVLSGTADDFVAKILPGMNVKNTLAVLGGRLASTFQKGMTVLRNVTSADAEKKEIEQLTTLFKDNNIDIALANLKAAKAAPKEETEGFIKGAMAAGKGMAKANLFPAARESYKSSESEGVSSEARASSLEEFFGDPQGLKKAKPVDPAIQEFLRNPQGGSNGTP